MSASDAKPVPQKNVAYRHYFAIRKNDGTLITSWAGQDSELSLDGGNFADATNEATEIQTSGCGYIDLTDGETNYDCITLKITVTNTGALPYVVNQFPEEAGDIRVNTVQLGGTTQTAADLGNKTGFALSEAGILAIWHQLLANITTAGSVGKLIKDYLDAAITSRGTLTAQQVWEYATRSLTDKAGFELIAAYNPAKSAAQAGDAMALVTEAITASKIAAGALSGKGDWNTVAPDNDGIAGTLEGVLSANASLSGVLTILAALNKLCQSNVILDTTTTPWTEKHFERGTGTLLLTRRLYDKDGNPITSIDTFIGQRTE